MNAREVAGAIVVQDPDATRRYSLDWGSTAVPEEDRWLAADEVLATFSVTADGGAVVTSVGADEKTVSFLLSGVNLTYPGHAVRVRISTSTGQSQDATFRVVAGDE